MNIKTFSILAIVTALLVIAAVNFTGKREAGPVQADYYKQQVFPELAKQLEQVTLIQLRSAEGTVTLARNEDKNWGVTEKHGYSADLEKIHKILLGAGDLRYLEQKTATPELHEKLNLRDVETEGSKAVQVTLEDAQGQTLADILVGKQKPARMDSTQKDVYVRKPGDNQTWLALGTLPVEYDKEPDNWLVKEVADVPQKRMREVVVTHAGGESVRVYKDSAEATDFQLADLPANGKVKSQYMVNNIAGFLAGLRLENVLPAEQVDFAAEDAVQAAFETFDGLRVKLVVVEKDDKHYAKLEAEYTDPPAPAQAEEEPAAEDEEAEAAAKETAPSPEEVQKEVEDLNKVFAGWAFHVAKFKMNNLLKPRAELFSISSEEEDNAEETGAAADAPSALPFPLTPPPTEEAVSTAEAMQEQQEQAAEPPAPTQAVPTETQPPAQEAEPSTPAQAVPTETQPPAP